MNLNLQVIKVKNVINTMSKQNAKSVKQGRLTISRKVKWWLDHYFRDSENGEVNTGECNLHKYLKRGLYVTSLYS
jgi:hypothetical protein